MMINLRASLDDEGRLVADRLAQLVRECGGASEVARRTDIPLRSLSKYIAGDATPSGPTIGKIARTLGRSADWILGLENASIGGEAEPDPAKYYEVPVLNVDASAGSGMDSGDSQIVGHWPFALSYLHRLGVVPAKARIVMARGDSMEPTILDGAPVLIDVGNRSPVDGRIYALLGPDGLRLKRIQRSMDGSFVLISDNKDLYASERIAPSEANQIKIVGRVFWTEKAI